jgi:hypothetical protein
MFWICVEWNTTQFVGPAAGMVVGMDSLDGGQISVKGAGDDSFRIINCCHV